MEQADALRLRITGDDSDYRAALARIGPQTQRTAAMVAGPGGPIAGIGSAWSATQTAIVGVAAALYGAHTAFGSILREYAKADKAQRSLTAALEQAGFSVEAHVSHLQEQAAALAKVSIADDEAIMSAQKLLISIGGLAGEGLDRATRAAVGLAAKLDTDVVSAAGALAKATQENFRELSRYSVEIKNATGQAAKWEAALRFGESGLKQAKAATEGLEGSTIQLSKSWDELKEALGGFASKGLEIPSLLADITEAINDLTDAIDKGGGSRWAAFGARVMSLANPAWSGTAAALGGVNAANDKLGADPFGIDKLTRDLDAQAGEAKRAREELARLGEEAVKAAEKAERAFRDAMTALDKQWAGVASSGPFAGLGGQPGIEFVGQSRMGGAGILENIAANDEAIFQHERDLQARLLELKIGAAEEWSLQAQTLEYDRINAAYQAEVDAAQARGEETTRIYEAWSMERNAIDVRYSEGRIRLAENEAQKELQFKMQVAGAVGGLINAMFGHSKAAAMAQAIINTYEGATKALAQGGAYGPALMAIVIATGMAQVAQIASTNIGSTGGGMGGFGGGTASMGSSFGQNWFDRGRDPNARRMAPVEGGRVVNVFFENAGLIFTTQAEIARAIAAEIIKQDARSGAN